MISTPHATETVNAEFGGGSWTSPATHYIGLSTTPITELTGLGFTEPTSAGYSRKAVTNNNTNWNINSDNYIVNTNTIEFDSFTTTLSGTSVAYWFISEKADASTAGDRADYYGQLLDGSGAVVTFPVISGGKIIISSGSMKLKRSNTV